VINAVCAAVYRLITLLTFAEALATDPVKIRFGLQFFEWVVIRTVTLDLLFLHDANKEGELEHRCSNQF
jgi:hypothetical protein